MRKWYEEAQMQSIQAVAQQLGMESKNDRYGPCPVCGSSKGGEHDTRPPLRFSKTKKKNDRWYCQNCDTMGNVFDLVSYQLHDCAAGELPQFSILREFFTSDTIHQIKKKPIKKKEFRYPPTNEVKAILDASEPLCITENKRVIAWTKRRGLDIKRLKNGPRVLNKDFDYGSLTQVPVKSGSTSWFPHAWATTYPVILPLVDYRGNLKSILGRAISPRVKRKSSNPIYYTTSNLFFVNKPAWEFLRGETRPATIWIVEGEMDFMSISQHDDIPVIGIRSGAIEHILKMPWHITQTVVIGTDNDNAGNKYAKQVAERIYPAQPTRLQLQILRKKGGQ